MSKTKAKELSDELTLKLEHIKTLCKQSEDTIDEMLDIDTEESLNNHYKFASRGLEFELRNFRMNLIDFLKRYD